MLFDTTLCMASREPALQELTAKLQGQRNLKGTRTCNSGWCGMLTPPRREEWAPVSCILTDGGGDQAVLGKETSEATGLTGL